MFGGIMSITDSIKNKYHQLKDSLRSSLFSKNKSILRISQFSKKSTIKKILTFTGINMFICIPYFIWFGSIGKIDLWLSMIIPSFAFVFLLSNTLFFSTVKFFSFIFKKKNQTKEVPLIIDWKEPVKDTVTPEYFDKSFMGRIKESLMAIGSVATTFIPFILLTNVMLVMYYLNQQTYFGVDSQFFSNFYNYLRIDSMLMVLFTTLTTASIYGVKFLLFLNRVLAKALSAQKNTVTSSDIAASPAYTPKRSLPVEDFIPSLSQEFRKHHNINATENLHANADIKKEG